MIVTMQVDVIFINFSKGFDKVNHMKSYWLTLEYLQYIGYENLPFLRFSGESRGLHEVTAVCRFRTPMGYVRNKLLLQSAVY